MARQKDLNDCGRQFIVGAQMVGALVTKTAGTGVSMGMNGEINQ